MYKKLTEQFTRDGTRAVYVNLDRVTRMAILNNGTTRLFFDGVVMIDVLETPETILDIEKPIVLTGNTEEAVDGGRSADEDGRISNNPIQSNS